MAEDLHFNITATDNRANQVFRRVADMLDGVRGKQERLTKVSRDAAAMSERLRGLEDKHADSLGRIKVAEQKLAEVRANSNAKASQVLRVEQQLLKARRDSARAASNVAREVERAGSPDGEKSGRSFTAGFTTWVTGRGRKDLEGAGRFGGSVFGSGFLGVLKTPVLGPAVLAALAAVAVTVAPAAGAVLGGAVVAGFGTGLATLGLVFAAKAKAVQDAWRTTMTAMAGDLRILSKPFEKTLLVLAAVAKRTFAGLKPELAGAFQTLAPAVAEFGDQLGRAFEKFGPSIRPVSEAFAAILKSLGPAMQSAISSVSDGMIRLSQSIKANPTALADFVRGIGTLVSDLLNFLAAMNNADAAFRRWTGGMSLVTAVMGAFRVALQAILGPITLAMKGLAGVGDSMNWLAGRLGIGTEKTNQAGEAANKYAQDVLAAGGANQTAGTAIGGTTARIAAQKAKTDALITSMHALSGNSLTLREAQVQMAQATADATAAIASNGRTLNLNTQKGRDNRRALDQVAVAANAQTDAMIRAGKSNTATAAAGAAARAKFVALATGMGMSKAEAQKLAVQLIDTQKKINALKGKVIEIKYTSNGVNLTTPSRVGGMAGGGMISGPGSGTSDRAGLYALSNQEWVIKAKSSQKYGDYAMDSVNRGTATIIPGMATGGPVVNVHQRNLFDSVAQGKRILDQMAGGPALAFARSQVGKPYVWGGVGPGGYDCSGWLSALVNVIRGRSPYHRLFTTASLPAGLFAKGSGRFNIGWFRGNPGHTAGTLNGVNVESRGGRGVVVGAGARGASNSLFDSGVWHLRGYARGGKVGDPPYDGFAEWLQNFVPSYARGTSYVPRDGLAYLHRGEKVSPASQSGRQEIVLTIDTGGSQMDELLALILRKHIRASYEGNVQKALGTRG